MRLHGRFAALACGWCLALSLIADRGVAAPAPSFRLAGQLVDAVSRAPIMRARVWITSNVKDLPFSESVQTDGEGRFLFSNLPPGKYSLFAEKRGYGAQGFQQHENFSTAIAVGGAADSEHLRFELIPQATITGQVMDDATGPVRDAEVLLFRKSRPVGRTQIDVDSRQHTDDQGRYRFAGLRPGTYYVAVNTRPWYAQFTAPMMHFQLRGPNGENLDFNIREGASAAGVPGNLQTLSGSAEGLSTLESVHTASSFKEATEPLAGAAVAVSAGELVKEEPSPLEVVYPMTYFQDTTDAAGAVAIVLRPGDSGTADFNLRAVPAVHMRIRTRAANEASGSPEGVAQIEYAQRGLGNYEAPIPVEVASAGPGVLEVRGLPPAPLVMRIGGGASASATVDAGQTSEFDATVVGSQIAVRGTLQLGDGPARPDQVSVGLRDRATGEFLTAGVAQDGTFLFQHPAGRAATYDVSLLNSELAVQSVTASGAKGWGQTVEVSGTQDVQLTIKAAKATANIKGVVLGRGEKPLAGAMILLVPTDADHNTALFRQEQSDTDGTFAIPGVMAGTYTLVAIENGWDLDWADAQVLAPYLSGGKRLDVAAERSYDFKVKAVAKTGEPGVASTPQ